MAACLEDHLPGINKTNHQHWRAFPAIFNPEGAPNGVLRRRERHHVIDLELDADLLPDLVIVV